MRLTDAELAEFGAAALTAGQLPTSAIRLRYGCVDRAAVVLGLERGLLAAGGPGWTPVGDSGDVCRYVLAKPVRYGCS